MAKRKEAEAEDEEKPKPKKKRRFLKLMLFPLIALLLAGGGLGAGFFLFGTGNPLEEVERIIEKHRSSGRQQESEQAENGSGLPRKVVKKTGNDAFVTTYYEFSDPITTNLRDSRRFLQVSLGLSTQYDDQVIENVDAHQLALRSDVIGVISGFSEEDIAGRAGRDDLAAAIRTAMNERLETVAGFGGIQTIHFSSFILQ